MNALDLILIALASFYVAYAVANTHGPFGAFEDLRARLPLGGLTSCMICLSPWASALFYLALMAGATWFVWIFAAAGVSVFAYRYTGGSNL